MNIRHLGAISLIAMFGLYGCSRNQDVPATASPTAVTAQPSESIKSYTATLSEGIDFKRDGYPSFLGSVKGMSGKESFGRWSDADEVIFEFKDPLRNAFSIDLKVATFPSSSGLTYKVKAGSIEKEFVLKTTNLEAMEKVSLTFDGVVDGRQIIIKVPKAQSPKELGLNSDDRRLGLALAELRIR